MRIKRLFFKITVGIGFIIYILSCSHAIPIQMFTNIDPQLQDRHDPIPQSQTIQIQLNNQSFIYGSPAMTLKVDIRNDQWKQMQANLSIDGVLWAHYTLNGGSSGLILPKVEDLTVGVHSVFIMVSDGVNVNFKSGIMTIIPNAAPHVSILKGPNFFFPGEQYTLKWEAHDQTIYHASYVLCWNNTEIRSGTWNSGQNNEIALELISPGYYNYTLRISDGCGGFASDQFMVIVSLPSGDDDGDGMPNGYELQWGFNPLENNHQGDPDADLLTNYEEFLYQTNPIAADTDGDTLSDGDEIMLYLTDPTKADTDGDGADDGEEIMWHTDPLFQLDCPLLRGILWMMIGILIIVTSVYLVKRLRVTRRSYPFKLDFKPDQKPWVDPSPPDISDRPAPILRIPDELYHLRKLRQSLCHIAHHFQLQLGNWPWEEWETMIKTVDLERFRRQMAENFSNLRDSTPNIQLTKDFQKVQGLLAKLGIFDGAALKVKD